MVTLAYIFAIIQQIAAVALGILAVVLALFAGF